jgi:hypothetical protein
VAAVDVGAAADWSVETLSEAGPMGVVVAAEAVVVVVVVVAAASVVAVVAAAAAPDSVAGVLADSPAAYSAGASAAIGCAATDDCAVTVSVPT